MSLPVFSKISDKITMIHLSDLDSNIYLIGKDMVVDTGTGFNFVRLYDIFKKLGVEFEQIKTVVNTHMHFDHTGGNKFFENAKFMIHENDANVVEKGDQEFSNAGFFGGELKPVEVSKKLKDGDIINGFKVIHTPGHSKGSICLLDEKNKLMISGDTLFADGVGRTDLPGGDENELEKSLEVINRMDIEKILPGHGDPVLKDGNKLMKKIMESVSDTV